MNPESSFSEQPESTFSEQKPPSSLANEQGNSGLSIKTLLAGLVTTVIISLAGELVFVLAAAYLGSGGEAGSFLDNYREQIWYLGAMLSHCLAMALGGALTVLMFSHRHHVQHAAIVGALASSSALLSLLSLGSPTLKSLLYVVLGSASAAFAAYLVDRYCQENYYQENYCQESRGQEK